MMPPPQQPVLLSPLVDADVQTLFAWINDRETVLRNASFAPVHFADQVAWFNAVRREKNMVIFGIRTAEDRRLVGSCQLHSIHPVHRSAELQIRIGEIGDRRKGFGRGALRLLLRHGFRDQNLHRIQLHAFADNIPAIRLYAGAGFREEGRLRQAAFIDGQYKDILVMGLLRAEFVDR